MIRVSFEQRLIELIKPRAGDFDDSELDLLTLKKDKNLPNLRTRTTIYSQADLMI